MTFRHPELSTIRLNKSIVNKVDYWIKRRYPPIAKHIVDLAEVLSKGLWRTTLNYSIPEDVPTQKTTIMTNYEIKVWLVIDEEGFASVLFALPRLMKKPNSSTIIRIDGTFYIAPIKEGVYQVLTFMAAIANKVVKIFFSKKKNRFENCFRK